MLPKTVAISATLALAAAAPASNMKKRDIVLNKVKLSIETEAKLGGQKVGFSLETIPSITVKPHGDAPKQRAKTTVNDIFYSPKNSSKAKDSGFSYDVTESSAFTSNTYPSELYTDKLEVPGFGTFLDYSFFFSTGDGTSGLSNTLDVSPGSDFLDAMGPQTKFSYGEDDGVILVGGFSDDIGGELYPINKTNGYTIDNVKLSLGGNVSEPFTVGLDFASDQEISYVPSYVINELGFVKSQSTYGYDCAAKVDFLVKLGDQDIKIPITDVVNTEYTADPELPLGDCPLRFHDISDATFPKPVATFGKNVLKNLDVTYDSQKVGFWVKSKN